MTTGDLNGIILLDCYLILGVLFMPGLIEGIFGDYAYQLIMQLNMLLQLVSSGLIFSLPLRRKKHWPLWLLLSLGICVVLLWGSVVFRTYYSNLATRFVMRFIQFSMPLIIMLLCFRNPLHAKLKTWCASIASMEIGAAVFSFLLALRGIDERVTISLISPSRSPNSLDWAIYFALHILIYCLLYRFTAPKQGNELDRASQFSTTLLTLACMVFLTVPDCVSNEFRAESWPMLLVNRSYLLALSAFILILCNGIELQSRYRTEMAVMDQVLSQERKQYLQLKENIDVINMHCHDLKHQLDDFSGKLTKEEIESLRDAMAIYDRNIRTGSEVLDVVIYLSQLTCEKESIELTCLADGAALGFMRTRHVYSLFNNALGNAIEAVRKLNEKGKRAISLTVAKTDKQVEIEITNFFDGILAETGGTTKADKGHHGFGTMSMRYIAELYHGTMTVQTHHDIYNLQISIPILERNL